MKLVHIIVAFNSPKDVLKLCEQIGLQKEEKHHIICIDNSDIEFKGLNTNIFKNLNQKFVIRYFPQRQNLGSASGFAIGMQEAYDSNAEWIWLHDQDGYPMNDCLENFQKYFGCNYLMAPQVIDGNHEYLNVFNGIIDKNDNIQNITLSKNENYTDVAATAGLIINRKLIDLIGVYDYKNYFIGQEDFDYCLRAKKAGINAVVLRDSIYFHPNKWPGTIRDQKKRVYNFGQIENNRTKGGLVYFNVFYARKFVLLSLLYSIIFLILKKLLGKKIRLRQTLSTYLIALKNRSLKRNKVIYSHDNSLSAQLTETMSSK